MYCDGVRDNVNHWQKLEKNSVALDVIVFKN